MKILILAHPRSGSTTLAKWLSSELNYELVLEPFNGEVKKSIPDKTNIVVKELYQHLLIENIVVSDFIGKFDIVIGLIRENITESIISMVRASDTNKHHEAYFINETELIKYNDTMNHYLPDFELIQSKIKESCDFLVTYETIYETKTSLPTLQKYLKIDYFKFLSMIDKKYRYRKNKVGLI